MRTQRGIVSLLLVLLVGCVAPGNAIPPSSEPWDVHHLIPSSGPDRERIVEVMRTDYDQPFTEESIAFHRELFADGEVTFEEYERALFAAADCLTEQGFNVLGPYTGLVVEPGMDSSKVLSFHYESRGSQYDDIAQECQVVWSLRIQSIWMTKLAPTASEIRIWLDAAWACARDKGLDLSDPPLIDDALNSVAFGCEPWTALPDR